MDKQLFILIGFAFLLCCISGYLLFGRKNKVGLSVDDQDKEVGDKNHRLSESYDLLDDKEDEFLFEENVEVQEEQNINRTIISSTSSVYQEKNEDVPSSPISADLFTEYQIYLQFGYLDKAARALSEYLAIVSEPSLELEKELLDLYLKCEQIDQYSNLLESMYQNNKIDRNDLEQRVISGLAQDLNNLDLRLLAQMELGWGPEDILLKLENVKINRPIQKIDPTLKVKTTKANTNKPKESVPQRGKTAQGVHHLLVGGHNDLDLVLDVAEKNTIAGFLSSKKKAQIFMLDKDYVRASSAFKEALKGSKRPLTLLVDLLRLDYCTKNVEAFISHYYWLLVRTRDQADLLKERLFGLGVKLTSHPFFPDVELVKNDQNELEEIGQKYNLSPNIDLGYKDASYKGKELVTNREGIIFDSALGLDGVGGEFEEKTTEINPVLLEAESRIEYGQITEAMDLLESALYESPEDKALYLYLLDLYRRLDDKSRLLEFSRKIREVAGSLPEEINLAISHLEQRMH